MRNTFCAFLFLHCDPAQSICHRADQDNGRKDGAQILDHEVEDLFTAEGLAAQRHLFFDLLHADHAGHQQADSNGCNGHHDRVGEEIEEIQKLHSEHRHARQRAIAQCRKAAQRHHDQADQCRCALAAPAQLVLKGGDSALCQGNGAGHGCKQHQ